MRTLVPPLQFYAPMAFWDDLQVSYDDVLSHLTFQLLEHQLSTENVIQLRVDWPGQNMIYMDMIFSLNAGWLSFPYRIKHSGNTAGIYTKSFKAHLLVGTLATIRALQLLYQLISPRLRHKLWIKRTKELMVKFPRLYVQGID